MIPIKKSQDCYRQRFAIEKREGEFIDINGKKLINFAGNDYLGIAHDPRVIKAFKQGVDLFGLGSSSSALVAGYYTAHQELEARFANYLKRDKALLFNSGYHANLAALSALTDKKTAVFSDKLCHASIIDAIHLSKAQHFRYAHHDFEHLKIRLNQKRTGNPLIISEVVFSMEGVILNLPDLVNIAKSYRARLMIDDAHGFGVLGINGAGGCEYFNLSQQDVAILVTPLGKALGGFGAIISGHDSLIETLIQRARPYMYSTATPPALSFAMLRALKILHDEKWRRVRLKQMIALFRAESAKRGLIFFDSHTPIQVSIIGNSDDAMSLQRRLASCGYYVAAIRPPSVAINTSRIRISLSALHHEEQIIGLLNTLEEILDESAEKINCIAI